MKTYILKRLLTMIPVFVITSVIIFSIIHLTPGDPARVILGDRAVEEEVIALQERMGLNKPLPVPVSYTHLDVYKRQQKRLWRKWGIRFPLTIRLV